MFTGLSQALYFGSGESQQTSSPPETKEEVKQETTIEETGQKAGAEDADTPEETKVAGRSASSEEKTDKKGAGEDDRDRHDATVRVTRVVDGDTVRISPAVEGIDEVRFIGLDTPETKEPGCAVQPLGSDATEFTTRELQGKEVDLEFDEDREDRYDRLLAYVHNDGEMFNETLLEEGYAQVYIVAPNDRYQDRFEKAQAEAQAAERRIWALPPAEQALLTDRGNGIGGDGCAREETILPPKAPSTPEPTPDPNPDPVPEPDPEPEPAPETPSAPAAPVPPTGSGKGGRLTCADFSTEAEASAAIPSNPQLDRDADGRACETLP